MSKIFINIDSRYRNRKIDQEPNNFLLNLDKLNITNINYIKLVDITIPNKYYIFTNNRNNNYFFIKGILSDHPRSKCISYTINRN